MAKKFKVVVTDFITDALEPENRILGDMADVTAFDALDEDELQGKIEDADAIMMYHNLALTRKTLERLERCKLIVRCGVGYDNVDHALCPRARHSGGQCARLRHRGSGRLGDRADDGADARNQPHELAAASGHRPVDVYASRAAAPLARPRVRHRRPGTHRHGRGVAGEGPGHGRRLLRSLQTQRLRKSRWAFAASTTSTNCSPKATFLSLHCPLTDETHYLVNRRTMAMLPAGAYLINTARGAVVDTAALPEALASGHLAGAGIDVLEHEPAAARSSVDRGLARSEPCRPPSADYQSPSGLLQRGGTDGHANQGIERLPKSAVRPADSECH